MSGWLFNSFHPTNKSTFDQIRERFDGDVERLSNLENGQSACIDAHPDAPLELYDLAADPHEDHNVAAEHPEIVAQLIKILKTARTPSALFNSTVPGAQLFPVPYSFGLFNGDTRDFYFSRFRQAWGAFEDSS